MRASRLVSLLLLLQARGRLTAAQIADELEVSVRTVYRDVESLHEAGIPLFGDAGHRGGYQLLDGYRTRLTGLSADEAKALFLSGLPGPASDLGLGPVLAAAQLKLLAALPPELSEQIGRVRFHLDAPGWFSDADEVPLLPAVASAVWRGRVLQVRYRRWKEPTDVDRRLEPYGLVLKAGHWYLVAGPGPRTYRVDQILELRVLDEEFVLPEGFELAKYWQGYLAEFRAFLHRGDAVVRLAPCAAAQLSGAVARAVAETSVPEAGGWIRAVVPIESVEQACREFLGFGPDIEVLEPAALRERISAAARATAACYELSNGRGSNSQTGTLCPRNRRQPGQVTLAPQVSPMAGRLNSDAPDACCPDRNKTARQGRLWSRDESDAPRRPKMSSFCWARVQRRSGTSA